MGPFDPIVTTAAHLCVALLFLGAVTAKLSNFSVFRATLAEYELLPGALTGIAAVFVATAELVIGMSALLPATARPAMVAAAVLLALYAAAIGINLARGRRDIDCGCTGPATRQLLSGWLPLRNAVLVALALVGAAESIPREMLFADWSVVVLAVAAGVALYAAVNQLMVNAPRLDALDGIMEGA